MPQEFNNTRLEANLPETTPRTMPLEYNVKREYTIPGLTLCFSAFSVVAIAGLTVLNIILQGYDIVTVLRPNPNITESYWWSTKAFSVRSAGECNPVSLSRKSAITTNSSLFSYELRGAFGANNEDIASATSYMANPLRGCTVDAIIAEIHLLKRTVHFNIPILCTSPDLPFSLSLTSQFSISGGNPYTDDVIAYYLQNRPSRDGLDNSMRVTRRNTSSLLNVIATIDAVSTDFMNAVWINWEAAVGNAPSIITTGGIPVCPGGQNTTCRPEEMRMMIPQCGLAYPNGTGTGSIGICPFLAPVETDILSMLTVLQDAYHIDFGNIQPSNTLLSIREFSSRIQSSLTLSQFVQGKDIRLCSRGLGCVQGSTWVEKLRASDPDINVTVPSVLAVGNTSAVVKIDYLCPEFRIKRPGSLITSVFIGTWSMYMALVGLFEVLGPILESRYGHARAGYSRDGKQPDL
ncbi:hypothetical protein RhiJN_02248 [Ceratobasidium sp. AG-Ba]|nr:hypothetical protein RhiJN_02248 [Ceratobasidium sp. AG-Ba]QRW03184.1 hypothetical protein RhiLY_02183 [Ceratobasidium sp. AG-Ba]